METTQTKNPDAWAPVPFVPNYFALGRWQITKPVTNERPAVYRRNDLAPPENPINVLKALKPLEIVFATIHSRV